MATSDIYLEALKFADTSKPGIPGRICPCLLCGKPFIMRIYIGEPDQICMECWETYKECAKLVCVKCKVTIGRIKVMTLDNGYRIQPRAILHSSACNICKPGLATSDILEIKDWERRLRPGKIMVAKR